MTHNILYYEMPNKACSTLCAVVSNYIACVHILQVVITQYNHIESKKKMPYCWLCM